MESEYPELEGTHRDHQVQFSECPTPNEAPRGRRKGEHQAGVRCSSGKGAVSQDCPQAGDGQDLSEGTLLSFSRAWDTSLCIHSLEWRTGNGIIAKITPQSLKKGFEPKRQRSLSWKTPSKSRADWKKPVAESCHRVCASVPQQGKSLRSKSHQQLFAGTGGGSDSMPGFANAFGQIVSSSTTRTGEVNT